MDTKQNISSIRHFLKKRHWVSDVFAGMCLQVMLGRDLKGVGDRNCICVYSVKANCEGSTHVLLGRDLKVVGDRNCICVYSVMANCEGSTCHAGKGFEGGGR